MKILITGGNGFLGRQVAKTLSEYEPITFSSSDFDLRDYEQTIKLFAKYQPTHVAHLAARLGGIGDNRSNPSQYFEDNILIGLNTLKACAQNNIEKVVNIGTVCSYPKITTAPFKEADLWQGYPEETNAAYGIAKRALISYSYALNQQYGLNTVNLLMANLYGPGDDFRPTTSHVIPALIKKIVHAKENNESLDVWGDGSPTRDFLYVSDAASAIQKALLSANNEINPVNIATGVETSIKQTLLYLTKKIGFKGEINFDKTKPNGQPKRVLDITRAKQIFNFKPEVNFSKGLDATIEFYFENRDFIENQKSKY